MALGQGLLALADPGTLDLFAIGAFLYLAVCFGLAALWTVYRIVRADQPRTHDHTFEAVPITTPVVLELSHATPLEDGVEAPALRTDEPQAPADADDRVEDAPLNKP